MHWLIHNKGLRLYSLDSSLHRKIFILLLVKTTKKFVNTTEIISVRTSNSVVYFLWPSFCGCRHLPAEKSKQIFVAFLQELRPLVVNFCAKNSMNAFLSYTTMYFPSNCYFTEYFILSWFSLFRCFNSLDLCQARCIQLLLFFWMGILWI